MHFCGVFLHIELLFSCAALSKEIPTVTWGVSFGDTRKGEFNLATLKVELKKEMSCSSPF